MSAGGRIWAAIPAAGMGTRMGGGVPKQYLSLRGTPLLTHVLERFCAMSDIAGIVVAIARTDSRWAQLGFGSNARVQQVPGGEQRCHSVLNCLSHLRKTADESDWVLVHDAARPCVRQSDIEKLISAVRRHAVGGILGLPVRDTMKRADAQGTITATVERTGLWHALTPQMFHVGELAHALASAIEAGREVTDEAQAMELMGRHPVLVAGHPDNIKVTRSEDLAMAELLLSRQEEGA